LFEQRLSWRARDYQLSDDNTSASVAIISTASITTDAHHYHEIALDDYLQQRNNALDIRIN
jgi:hypothetical protein